MTLQMSVSWKFQGCFKKISEELQHVVMDVSSKSVPRKSQECFKGLYIVCSSRGVSKMFQVSYGGLFASITFFAAGYIFCRI